MWSANGGNAEVGVSVGGDWRAWGMRETGHSPAGTAKVVLGPRSGDAERGPSGLLLEI